MPEFMNADLKRERSKASFKSKDLTPCIYGPHKAKQLQFVASLVTSNPAFNTSDLWYISREERRVAACNRALQFVKLCREHSLLDDEGLYSAFEMMSGEDMFLNLHLTMFLPTLEKLADDLQSAKWIPLAKDFRMIGTYAQTELAHGSNVAGLQTTADLDLDTDEWVLNTPTLESSKWWPGGLAKSCNYCVLMARLRIKQVDHGVHPFLLQVRNAETHQSLPGVFLFDIGQKLGYEGVDNGGMQLHGVRIPRENLLQRYFRVDKKGNYSKEGNERMLYSVMTYTRKQLILLAGPSLAKAVTIATRYSLVRRQFPRIDEDVDLKRYLTEGAIPEQPVMDYSTQQFILFPLIAMAVGFIYAGRLTEELYDKMMAATLQNDFSRLNETHILTSALKSTMTLLVSDGMEAARRSLGGHGFLLASGLPLLYTSYVPQATYEGDFVILSIQCARGLLRLLEQRLKNGSCSQSSDSTQNYIENIDPQDFEAPQEFEDVGLLEPANLLKYFERRTLSLVRPCALRMVESLATMPPLAALDEEKIAFTRITKAHCHAIVLKAFLRYTSEEQTREKQPAVRGVLQLLLRLYGLYWMEASFAEFVAARVLRLEHHENLMALIKSTMKELRPNIIAIVDGFGFPDVMLNSVLGRYDGNVYQALFDATARDPMNKSDVSEGYYRYIQYILHPERLQSARL